MLWLWEVFFMLLWIMYYNWLLKIIIINFLYLICTVCQKIEAYLFWRGELYVLTAKHHRKCKLANFSHNWAILHPCLCDAGHATEEQKQLNIHMWGESSIAHMCSKINTWHPPNAADHYRVCPNEKLLICLAHSMMIIMAIQDIIINNLLFSCWYI
jgi:hypothetical protein